MKVITLTCQMLDGLENYFLIYFSTMLFIYLSLKQQPCYLFLVFLTNIDSITKKRTPYKSKKNFYWHYIKHYLMLYAMNMLLSKIIIELISIFWILVNINAIPNRI